MGPDLQNLFLLAWERQGSSCSFNTSLYGSTYKISALFLGLNLNLLTPEQHVCLKYLNQILTVDPDHREARFLRGKLLFRGHKLRQAASDFFYLKERHFAHPKLPLYEAYTQYLIVAQQRQFEIDEITLDRAQPSESLPSLRELRRREIGERTHLGSPLAAELEALLPILNEAIDCEGSHYAAHLLKGWIELIIKRPEEQVRATIEQGRVATSRSLPLCHFNHFIQIYYNTPLEESNRKLIRRLNEVCPTTFFFWRILDRMPSPYPSSVLLLADQALFLINCGYLQEGAQRLILALNLELERDPLQLTPTHPAARLINTLEIGYDAFQVWLKQPEKREAEVLIETLKSLFHTFGEQILTGKLSRDDLKRIYDQGEDPQNRVIYNLMKVFILRRHTEFFGWDPRWRARVFSIINYSIRS